MCVDETWGTVSSDSWQTTAAIVVCTQLGYSSKCEINYWTQGKINSKFVISVLCILVILWQVA